MVFLSWSQIKAQSKFWTQSEIYLKYNRLSLSHNYFFGHFRYIVDNNKMLKYCQLEIQP